MPRHQYVCVYYIRFIRLGHSHRRAATPSRGRFGVGAPRTLVHCHPPDGGTHGHGDRESYTVQTNPEAPSLSACRCIAPCRACNCVPSTRSDVDCSVKLPGNRPGDYITHTYWWVQTLDVLIELNIGDTLTPLTYQLIYHAIYFDM